MATAETDFLFFCFLAANVMTVLQTHSMRNSALMVSDEVIVYIHFVALRIC